jgi:hypothetical protein
VRIADDVDPILAVRRDPEKVKAIMTPALAFHLPES